MDHESRRAPDLQAAIAGRVRELRIGRRCRMDELAEAARRFGFGWGARTVAKIETRRRALAVEEMIAVALAFEVQVSDLLPTAGDLQITSSLSMAAEDVRALYRGRFHRATSKSPSLAPDLRDPAEPGRLALMERAAQRQAERKAAHRLSGLIGRPVSPVDVVAGSWELWGEGVSLTDRRNQLSRTGAPSRSLQSQRGHVTQRLVEELAEHMSTTKEVER